MSEIKQANGQKIKRKGQKQSPAKIYARITLIACLPCSASITCHFVCLPFYTVSPSLPLNTISKPRRSRHILYDVWMCTYRFGWNEQCLDRSQGRRGGRYLGVEQWWPWDGLHELGRWTTWYVDQLMLMSQAFRYGFGFGEFYGASSTHIIWHRKDTSGTRSHRSEFLSVRLSWYILLAKALCGNDVFWYF